MATIQDVVDEARVTLQDAAKTRYSDAQLLRNANAALAEALRLRPDLFFSSLSAPLATYALVDTFPLPAQYLDPVQTFVAGRAELRDDEYAVDGRAAALVSMYKSSLVGGL